MNESKWEHGNVPDMGLSEENRKGLCQMLNAILADEYVLYTKARNYHWNVLGIHFNDLHSFFQKIYEELAIFVDTIAERVRALGGRSYGTLEEFINTTRLTESPGEVPSPGMMVENLLSDFETLIRAMRPDVDTAYDTYGDAVTNNMLIEILTAHEKTAWMLRALADEVYGSECLRNQQC